MRVVFLLTACTAMAAPGFKGGNIPLSFEPDTGQATTESALPGARERIHSRNRLA